jgi:hypothetical protein
VVASDLVAGLLKLESRPAALGTRLLFRSGAQVNLPLTCKRLLRESSSQREQAGPG